jgi:hypothetical protein
MMPSIEKKAILIDQEEAVLLNVLILKGVLGTDLLDTSGTKNYNIFRLQNNVATS